MRVIRPFALDERRFRRNFSVSAFPDHRRDTRAESSLEISIFNFAALILDHIVEQTSNGLVFRTAMLEDQRGDRHQV